MTFDRHELEMIERALKRLTDGMRDSPYIGEEDPHLLKCEALVSKVRDLKTNART